MWEMVGLCQQDSDEGFAVETRTGFDFHMDSPRAVRPVVPDHNVATKDLLSSSLNERLDLWEKFNRRLGRLSGTRDRHALL
ncbi:MAG: hypothetical protein C0491_08510 [Novosphingobium sp.]|nr:hypothetical protein [Novosphingobium sp.]